MISRSVFVSVPHGTSAGNMLRAGGLLDRLQEFDATLPIVLLSPAIAVFLFVLGIRLLSDGLKADRRMNAN